MFKVVASLLVFAVVMVSAQLRIVAPEAPIARYATPYVAAYPGAPLAYYAQPYVARLALPAAASYSQYSRVVTPNSYSQQYQSEQKPLPYSIIY